MATVLAVDKDTFQLDLLAYVLGTRGHRVHPTTDPEVALEDADGPRVAVCRPVALGPEVDDPGALQPSRVVVGENVDRCRV